MNDSKNPDRNDSSLKISFEEVYKQQKIVLFLFIDAQWISQSKRILSTPYSQCVLHDTKEKDSKLELRSNNCDEIVVTLVYSVNLFGNFELLACQQIINFILFWNSIYQRSPVVVVVDKRLMSRASIVSVCHFRRYHSYNIYELSEFLCCHDEVIFIDGPTPPEEKECDSKKTVEKTVHWIIQRKGF